MAISKIILNGVTQMDVTQDTVASSNLLSGYTATKNDGTQITGSYVPEGSTINNQNKTVTPSESQQSITADSGYTGLGTVTVEAIASDYVGSGVARRGSSDLTQSSWSYYTNGGTSYIRAKINAESGYYASSVSVSFVKGIDFITDLPKQEAVTITPSESQQTAVEGYKWLTGDITVDAIPSDYVGTGVTRRSSTDLTASGATVTVPSGYYSAEASKAVASGTEGTPTATKGTISNHSVSVTPSVTNTTGYITGGTKNGTAVTVSASELVSGSETKTANGTYDVTNLASLVVDIPFSTIYSGTSDPSDSLGQNGDIYLKVVE